MTSTMESERKDFVAEPVDLGKAKGRSPFFTIFAVVLAALVGFGVGWLVFRDSGTDVPSEVSDVLDGYLDAWNAHDGDAAVAYMTSGGVHVSDFTPGASGEELASAIDASVAFRITDVETLEVYGDNPYFVIQSGDLGGDLVYSAFVMREQFGELKIQAHLAFSPGSYG